MSKEKRVLIREKDKTGLPIILVVSSIWKEGDHASGYIFGTLPEVKHSGVITRVL